MTAQQGKKQVSQKEDSSPASSNDNVSSYEQQLERAQAAIESSQVSISELHHQWRSHLLRMGIMVIIITLHQSYAPAKQCFEEVSDWNQETGRFSSTQVAFIVMSDSLVFLMALIMSCLLVIFMRSSQHTFANPFYMAASALTPVMVALHFVLQQHDTHESVPDCVASNFFIQVETNDISTGKSSRAFPAVLIFHCIVSGCYFFMAQQQAKQARNLTAIRELRDELNQEKKNE